MNIISLELLFTLMVLFCMGAYFIGKKKNISILRCIGRRGFFISLVLLVFETFIMVKRGIDLS